MTKFSTSPYPGLRPFRPDESDIFFGREEQTDRLLERLQRSHFLAVVGPSGCGKSSLVRAGMIAALETGFMADAGSRWRIAEMRPGDRPISRLARALSTAQALGPERAASVDGTVLLEAALRRGPLGLTEVLDETPLPDQTNLLLLVDQFEEIFRFREKGDPDEADAFVALLLATSQKREAQVYVVITMRTDFLGECTFFKGLPEAINESQYLTPRLIREQCRAAIVGPSKVCGGDVEPVLVNRLLNDFGPDPDQLPLLQHALMRMWVRVTARVSASGESANGTLYVVPPNHVMLTIRDYEELGGLSRALSDHADEVLKELTDPQRKIAETMFRRLAERGVGKRDMRTPAYFSDVAAVAGVSESDVKAVVETFRRPDRCFVTPAMGTPLDANTLLDIGHESLIRQWRQLGEWVDEEGRSALMYRRLNQTAQLWKAGDAALWRNPDLERALQWQHKQNPSSAWAARYGKEEEFQLAMEFLLASEHAWSEEHRRQEERERQAEQETARQRELEAQREKILELRRRAFVIAGVAFVTIFLSATSVWMWFRAQLEAERATQSAARLKMVAIRAEEQERIATALRLALQSSDLLNKDLQLSLLLAVEAVRATESLRVPAAEQALMGAVAQIGGRLVARSEARITALAISPDGQRLLTASEDKTARLWEADSGKPLVTFMGHTAPVYSAQFSPDGRIFVTASADDTARLWEADSGKLLAALVGHRGPVYSAVFSPDGLLVLTASEDGTARLWKTSSGELLNTLDGHRGPVYSAVFSPNGLLVLTASEDGTARLWKTSSGKFLSASAGHTGPVYMAQFSPDGRYVMTTSDDGLARLWLLTAEGRLEGPPLVFRGERGGSIKVAAIRSDNRWLVTASSDGTAELWDLVAKDPAANPVVLHGKIGSIDVVKISQDNHWLVTANWTGAAQLWDLTAKDPAANPVPLPSNQTGVNAVAISPNGRWLVTGGLDGTVRQWLLQTIDLIDQARAEVRRNLTPNEWELYFPGEPYRKTFPDL